MDRPLLWITLALLFCGLTMGYSASMVMARESLGNSYYFVVRQACCALGGLMLMIAAIRIDYRRLDSHKILIPAFCLAIAALSAVFYFHPANGARRWIRLAALSLQPSEFVKLFVVVFLAFYLSRRDEQINDLKRGLLPCVIPVGLLAGLILKEPDLGTSTFILLIATIMLLAAGLCLRYVVIALAAALPAMYLLVFSVAYRRNRMLAFLDPLGDPLGIGYQIRQSLITIGSGGPWGAGLANGKQKLFFLPMPHTDFIYAVIGEELGLWGCALVLVLFLLLFWRGLKIAVRARDEFGYYLALGLTNLVVIQSMINMSVVLSLMPNKGLPLPLISMGGSSLMATLLGMGLLLNVSAHSVRRLQRNKPSIPISRAPAPAGIKP
ncbi:MAG TPA: putative lipid II flippase FtsW [Acidobacteriota bacterium]|jgi:cell division protein FtsW